MPTLAAVMSVSLSKARSLTKSDMVKPIPARQPAPTTWAQVTPAGSRPLPLRTTNQLMRVIPNGLPTTSPAMIPRASGLARISTDVAAQRHPGIGEGEERQDEPDLNRVQGVLEHEARGQGVAGPDVDGLHRIELLLVGDDAAARLDLVLCLVEKGLGFDDELLRL